jgi:hypothetical protein
MAAICERNVTLLPKHTTLPAFSGLMIDASGNLWVRDVEPRTSWQVFGADGVLVAKLTLPEGFEIMDVGDDWILGTITDELGVERVRKYAIRKGF